MILSICPSFKVLWFLFQNVDDLLWAKKMHLWSKERWSIAICRRTSFGKKCQIFLCLEMVLVGRICESFFFVEVVTLVHVSKKSILIVIRGCYLLGKQTALQIFPKLVGWTMMVKARVLSNSLTSQYCVCRSVYVYDKRRS